MSEKKLSKEIGWILQEKYRGKLTPAAKKDIARFRRGEPLDHIIGFTDFLGCNILVDKNVLIPRFETEFWTEKAIDEIKNGKPFAFAQAIGSESPRARRGKIFNKLKILDMFAGSGCIGIAILKNVKNSHVVLVESQKEAVAQIKKNCKLNKIPENRYKIIGTDIFSGVNLKSKILNHKSSRFDYIFANPPYIPTVRKNKIQKSVLDYEPHVALFGGSDGFLYIRKFLKKAKDFLKPGGKIYMEFDTIQKNQINKLLKKYHYKNWKFQRDQYDKWRWVAVNN